MRECCRQVESELRSGKEQPGNSLIVEPCTTQNYSCVQLSFPLYPGVFAPFRSHSTQIGPTTDSRPLCISWPHSDGPPHAHLTQRGKCIEFFPSALMAHGRGREARACTRKGGERGSFLPSSLPSFLPTVYANESHLLSDLRKLATRFPSSSVCQEGRLAAAAADREGR